MVSFVIRRIVRTLPAVLLGTVVVFLLLRLIPGDPALTLAGPEASPQVIAAVRTDLGLTLPLPAQYAIWLGHTLRGDLGRSYVNGVAVGDLIAQRLPPTLELTLLALVLGTAVGLPTGVLAALDRRSPAAWVVSFANAIFVAIPSFWLGIVGVIVFALVLGWLPPAGYADPLGNPLAGLRFLLLPALTLAVGQSATVSRFTMAAVLEVLHEDYIRTARAKGLARWVVVVRHVVRPALIPIVTSVGVQFSRLLGGAVIVESLFAWPGMGRLMLQAIGNRDYVVIQGSILVLMLCVIAANLLTDVLYGVLDPRVRVSGRAAG